MSIFKILVAAKAGLRPATAETLSLQRAEYEAHIATLRDIQARCLDLVVSLRGDHPTLRGEDATIAAVQRLFLQANSELRELYERRAQVVMDQRARGREQCQTHYG